MSEPVNQINNVLGTESYQRIQPKSAAQPASGVNNDTAQTSSRYIISDHSIIFERYDRHGKLISRVPWTAHPIDERA